MSTHLLSHFASPLGPATTLHTLTLKATAPPGAPPSTRDSDIWAFAEVLWRDGARREYAGYCPASGAGFRGGTHLGALPRCAMFTSPRSILVSATGADVECGDSPLPPRLGDPLLGFPPGDVQQLPAALPAGAVDAFLALLNAPTPAEAAKQTAGVAIAAALAVPFAAWATPPPPPRPQAQAQAVPSSTPAAALLRPAVGEKQSTPSPGASDAEDTGNEDASVPRRGREKARIPRASAAPRRSNRPPLNPYLCRHQSHKGEPSAPSFPDLASLQQHVLSHAQLKKWYKRDRTDSMVTARHRWFVMHCCGLMAQSQPPLRAHHRKSCTLVKVNPHITPWAFGRHGPLGAFEEDEDGSSSSDDSDDDSEGGAHPSPPKKRKLEVQMRPAPFSSAAVALGAERTASSAVVMAGAARPSPSGAAASTAAHYGPSHHHHAAATAPEPARRQMFYLEDGYDDDATASSSAPTSSASSEYTEDDEDEDEDSETSTSEEESDSDASSHHRGRRKHLKGDARRRGRSRAPPPPTGFACLNHLHPKGAAPHFDTPDELRAHVAAHHVSAPWPYQGRSEGMVMGNKIYRVLCSCCGWAQISGVRNASHAAACRAIPPGASGPRFFTSVEALASPAFGYYCTHRAHAAAPVFPTPAALRAHVHGEHIEGHPRWYVEHCGTNAGVWQACCAGCGHLFTSDQDADHHAESCGALVALPLQPTLYRRPRYY